jgi:hypothetical protein
MLTVTPNLTHSLNTKTSHCLGAGINTSRLDEYLDYLFELAAMHGPLTCECQEDRIQVKTAKEQILDREIPRAKTKVRLLCARLEKRASDTRGDVSSMETDEIVFNLAEHAFAVAVSNTAAMQRISITRIERDVLDASTKS